MGTQRLIVSAAPDKSLEHPEKAFFGRVFISGIAHDQIKHLHGLRILFQAEMAHSPVEVKVIDPAFTAIMGGVVLKGVPFDLVHFAQGCFKRICLVELEGSL